MNLSIVQAQYDGGYDGSYDGGYDGGYGGGDGSYGGGDSGYSTDGTYDGCYGPCGGSPSLSGTVFLERDPVGHDDYGRFSPGDSGIPNQLIQLIQPANFSGPNGLSLNGHLAGSEFSDADIAEVVVYSRSLTDTEREAVERYLNTKWNVGIGIPASTISTPADIPGLGLWIDADNAPSITLAGGDKVSQWKDLSGNNRHFETQVIAAHQVPSGYDENGNPTGWIQIPAETLTSTRPSLLTAGLNGKNIVRFDAASHQTLTNPTDFSLSSTIIYLSRQRTGNNARVLSGLANNWLLGYWAGGRDQAYFNGSVLLTGPNPPSDTNWHIYSGVQGPYTGFYGNSVPLATPSSVGYQATTDSNGHYLISNITSGLYFVYHTLQSSGSYIRVNPVTDFVSKTINNSRLQSFGLFGPFFTQSAPQAACIGTNPNIELNWSASQGADNYEIWYITSTNNTPVKVNAGNVTTYNFTPATIPPLTPGTQYGFLIVAFTGTNPTPLAYSDDGLWSYQLPTSSTYTTYPNDCASVVTRPAITFTVTTPAGTYPSGGLPVSVDQNSVVTLNWTVTNAESTIRTSNPSQSYWNSPLTLTAGASSGTQAVTTSIPGPILFNLSATNASGTSQTSIQLNIQTFPRPYFQTRGGDIHTNETIYMTP